MRKTDERNPKIKQAVVVIVVDFEFSKNLFNLNGIWFLDLSEYRKLDVINCKV